MNDDAPIDWERLARDSAATLLLQSLANVDETVSRLEYRLRGHANDPLDADDVRAARGALYELEQTIEENVLPVVDDVEPYETAADHIPYSVLLDRMDLERESLFELEEGAVPAAAVKTETRVVADGGKNITQAVVKFEVPAEIADEIRAERGELDVDLLSDRVVPVPVIDGEPV